MGEVVDVRRRWLNRFIGWWLLVLLLSVVDSQYTHTQRKILTGGNNTDLPSYGVRLLKQGHKVVMNNGIVSITLTTPGGTITSISYKGSDNLLQTKDKDEDSGNWNVIWNKEAAGDTIDKLEGTDFEVILQNENQTEISFTRTWKVGSSSVPLNVDKRFVMLRDSPGFYSYAVLERLQGWPAFHISEGRIVFQLRKNREIVAYMLRCISNRFYYMAMSDERQRFMPTYEDRQKGQALDYKEAVLLTNPSNPEFKGEVDDKYFYTCNDEDNKVHGWVSNDDPPVGFWLVTPSDEFRTGGPIRQDLTSHVGPFTLAKFSSRHYAGEDLAIKFQSQEYWKKVIGPFYIHLNSDASAGANPSILWGRAKQRMEEEVNNWPYSFPLSKDFVKSNQRGSISGQLSVEDRFLKEHDVSYASAYVGLAPRGSVGSWQFENKGYQFWTHADNKGKFLIKNVIPGTYSLFAWVPGVVGDYKHDQDIIITPGSNITATNVVFKAPRTGPTLWEIGIPDRSAAEFFIPDPDPKFKIHRYSAPIEKFRQYGLWSRYSDLYPHKDLVYTVGTSDYRKDWFFAHVTRDVGNGRYNSTTWQILFDLDNVKRGANYTVQLALASAQNAELQVRFNDEESAPYFSTGLIGMDNALARHGIRGLYRFYSIGVAGSQLVNGRNIIFLKQARDGGSFKQVMYDYIRLEGPA